MHFNKHIFFCTNQKDDNKKCCAMAGATDMFTYAKQKITIEGLAANNQVRVSKSGCLGRCAEGPCVVVYPEGVWYTYQDEADIDEIVREDLGKGKRVDRLLIDKPPE